MMKDSLPSALSPPSTLPTVHALWPAHAALPDSIGVAFSGGMDSTVLLHWLSQHLPASISLSAYHVHHALQAGSEQWIHHCQQFCETFKIPFLSHSLDPNTRKASESIEAWARTARYQWLAQQTPPCFALGHHQHDQVETLLLQLLRGTGIAGLASMSALHERHSKLWWRPFLSLPRQELEAYALAHQLTWIEDPSNQDTRFHRNWVRHTLLPVLKDTYPHVEHSLARTASHCAEYWDFIESSAEEDRQHCSPCSMVLDLNSLKNHSPFRQKQIIRSFIRLWTGLFPNTAVLEEAYKLFLMPIDTERHRPSLRLGDISFSVWQEYAWVHLLEPLSSPYTLPLMIHSTEQKLLLQGGELHLSGLPHRTVTEGYFIMPRKGGERLIVNQHRSFHLKRIWQEAGIPPWDRQFFPCLYNTSGQLVWAPTTLEKTLPAHYKTLYYSGKGRLLEDYPELAITWHPKRHPK
jgi:tRNA(Ile)-lysidine synthase